MNLFDMKFLIEVVKITDDEIRIRAMEFNGAGKNAQLKSVQIIALQDHKERLIVEFEQRHGVVIER